MYVRQTRIKRGIGTHDSPYRVYSYWQLVHGYRSAKDGKVRQKVIAHLGKAESRTHAETRARMRGLLCGRRGCGKAPTEELTWRFDDQPPVLWERLDKEYGAAVCQEHLDEWHAAPQWPGAGPPVVPLYQADHGGDGTNRARGRSLL